jgi:glutamate-ammonia-ligase adenylyltransferase
VLFLPRNKSILREEVLAMRAKINRYTDENQVKYALGGLLDLEFLVQFLVLAHPKESILRYTNTLHFLQILAVEQLINQEQATKLKQAYKRYHYLLHQNVLQPSQQDYQKQQIDVRAISQTLYTR